MFGEYAGSGTWTVVHLSQFGGMAIFLAGLLALYFALDAHAGTARWAARFGAAAAVATMALYGLLQAVDGVALKQAVTAWVSAPDAEKAARFASAEAIRWLEWGVRSYQNVALGLALLLFAVAAVRAAWVPRPVVVLMGLSGLADLVQGTVVDSVGVLADGVDRHRGGFRPGRGVDDLAARGRVADADYAGLSPRPMTAAGH